MLLFISFCLFGCINGEFWENRRIYNGIKVKPDFLYQAAVASNEKEGRVVICGGAIVDERHILTAGHCLEKGPMSVRIGSLNLDDKTGTWHEVVKYVSPYINNTYTNDIAILNIDPPIKFTSTVKPIQLPDGKKYKTLPKSGTIMTVSGWGFVNTEKKSDYLLSVNLTVIPEKKCKKKWPGNSKKRICVQGAKPGFGTCGGDSGGPLVHGKILYGVLSYGTENCSLGAPEVYTRVYSYMPWIKKQLHNLRKKQLQKFRYENEALPRNRKATVDTKHDDTKSKKDDDYDDENDRNEMEFEKKEKRNKNKINSNGNDKKNINGNDKKNINGKNIKNFNGKDIKNFNGTDQNNGNGKKLNNVTGKDINNVNGNDINNVNGNDINNVNGNDINNGSGNDINNVSGNDINNGIGNDINNGSGKDYNVGKEVGDVSGDEVRNGKEKRTEDYGNDSDINYNLNDVKNVRNALLAMQDIGMDDGTKYNIGKTEIQSNDEVDMNLIELFKEYMRRQFEDARVSRNGKRNKR